MALCAWRQSGTLGRGYTNFASTWSGRNVAAAAFRGALMLPPRPPAEEHRGANRAHGLTTIETRRCLSRHAGETARPPPSPPAHAQFHRRPNLPPPSPGEGEPPAGHIHLSNNPSPSPRAVSSPRVLN